MTRLKTLQEMSVEELIEQQREFINWSLSIGRFHDVITFSGRAEATLAGLEVLEERIKG